MPLLDKLREQYGVVLAKPTLSPGLQYANKKARSFYTAGFRFSL